MDPLTESHLNSLIEDLHLLEALPATRPETHSDLRALRLSIPLPQPNDPTQEAHRDLADYPPLNSLGCRRPRRCHLRRTGEHTTYRRSSAGCRVALPSPPRSHQCQERRCKPGPRKHSRPHLRPLRNRRPRGHPGPSRARGCRGDAPRRRKRHPATRQAPRHRRRPHDSPRPSGAMRRPRRRLHHERRRCRGARQRRRRAFTSARATCPSPTLGASSPTPRSWAAPTTAWREALESQAAGADYLAVGAVYATATMGKSARKPFGPETIAAVKAAVSQPVVAIGGIDQQQRRRSRARRRRLRLRRQRRHDGRLPRGRCQVHRARHPECPRLASALTAC